MSARERHTCGPILAYHGCDRGVAEQVLGHSYDLKPSENKFDWLGPGVYFWVDSPARAVDWAVSQQRRLKKIGDPYLVGAYMYPGLCLNLMDYAAVGELRNAYASFSAFCTASGFELPRNDLRKDGIHLKRALDCAVISAVHELRECANLPPYDTVLGVFEEGPEMYPGAGMREKTHMQIAVRNPQMIVGYFRVRGFP